MEFILLVLILASMATTIAARAKPGCNSTCGELDIPYPFGTTDGCSRDENFLITCSSSTSRNPIANYSTGNIQVLNISLDGEMRILAWRANQCYLPSGNRSSGENVNFSLNQFTVSNTKNKFTVIGCDTYTFINDYWGDRFSTGCTATCRNTTDVVNGTCFGIGCCQTSFPTGVRGYNISLKSYRNHTAVWNFNPCSYGFVVEDGYFNFSSLDLKDLRNKNDFPVVINWAIGNETCQKARRNATSYACMDNSFCVDSENAYGYLCKCKGGFSGNPYLSGSNGCRDIDECKTLRPCSGTCHNLFGSYYCSCPVGYKGDGLRNSTGCTLEDQSKRFSYKEAALGAGLGFAALLVIILWLYLVLQQRKLIKLKERFFRQNGGLILQQKLSRQEWTFSETAKIFTTEELKKATKNYDEDLIIGKGGFGIVYKGFLADNRVVAIKKSKIVDQSQIEQFINEVVVLSQINHRNVVKLLGCCLETEVPLLVYEFVNNGTLLDYIHGKSRALDISWTTRLRIAAETAGALSYLHSSASTPIIHRDVKTANILLDESYTAKVSDFGASRLVPIDQTELATMVQGTLGYLDPEYMLTSQLTEKSDVYSFGVVLVELLTGRKALSFDRPEEERSLAMYFLSNFKEDQLFEVIESGLVNDGNKETVKEFARLATRCLKLKAEDRPGMKEVGMELEGLRRAEKHPWVSMDRNFDESEYLLPDMSGVYVAGDSISVHTAYDSLKEHVLIGLGKGR
ncbi:Wall-associated receptor kinase [Quillaja saponaria]|uniref:Wall-associated receptor kinase n=1 Tax=Quillaja saponaria TaxID=32244 RepID=A0AAD7LLG4_QUISA|nr:Wall-associated receptor kinase [Quillaja saponaria]